jgi:hypothetical protein
MEAAPIESEPVHIAWRLGHTMRCGGAPYMPYEMHPHPLPSSGSLPASAYIGCAFCLLCLCRTPYAVPRAVPRTASREPRGGPRTTDHRVRVRVRLAMLVAVGLPGTGAGLASGL